jgi:hypothetical protein
VRPPSVFSLLDPNTRAAGGVRNRGGAGVGAGPTRGVLGSDAGFPAHAGEGGGNPPHVATWRGEAAAVAIRSGGSAAVTAGSCG